MDGRWNKGKRGSITEEGISTLLRRYPVKTVLQLLQEVAISAAERIDWNAVVKNSKTGISSPREYQMLWRHLAYGHALTDQMDDFAVPLDDDSDLEFEEEAFPVVSWESSMEALACVKALVASEYPIDSHVPNLSTVEAPLQINIPMFKVPSDGSLPAKALQGKNIIIPFSIEKEEHYSETSDVKRPNVKSGDKRQNAKSGAAVPSKKKRKGWSTEDDLKLTAAVKKHGEQNWAYIAGGDFKNDRTPADLSLRWTSIKKRKANLNIGTSAELSEAQKAATRAIFLALEPKGNNMKAVYQMSNAGTRTTQNGALTSSAPSSIPHLGPPKSGVLSERPPSNSTASMIKVAAVAAGARIATRPDTSSLAATSQNVVHITTGPTSRTNSSTATMENQLPSNTRHNGQTKPQVTAFPSTFTTLERSDANEAHGKVVESAEVAGVSTSASRANKLVQRVQGSGLVNVLPKGAMDPISKDQPSLLNLSKLGTDKCTPASGSSLGLNAQGDQASASLSRPVIHSHHRQVGLPCPEVEENGKNVHGN